MIATQTTSLATNNQQTAIQTAQSKKLNEMMRREDVMKRFEQVVGGSAGGYVASVLLAVAGNDQLQTCEPMSIISAGLRAATMQLSVDPSIAQAYIVPFAGKATFMVGYKGLMQMAIRTGKYKYLNLVSVYEDQKFYENILTGLITFDIGKVDAVADHNFRLGQTPVAYLLYIELLSGYKKTFMMTVSECDAHGQKYSKNYFKDGKPNPKSMWHSNPHAMYKKTVVRQGISKYGYLDPHDLANMSSLEDNEEDANDFIRGTSITEVRQSAEQSIQELMGESSTPSDLQDEPGMPEEPPSEPVPSQPAGMTYEEAATFGAGNGSLYVNMTNAQLDGHKIGLIKKLQGELNVKEQGECQNKLDAIKVLLSVPEGQRLRAQGQPTLIK